MGGDPKKVDRHEQEAWLLEEIVHWAFSPQGEGLQGSLTGSSAGRKRAIKKTFYGIGQGILYTLFHKVKL